MFSDQEAPTVVAVKLPNPIDPLFEVHLLNTEGKEKAAAIASSFSALLGMLVTIVGETNNREFSIVKTKLEEAAFFAKKAMAIQPKNQLAEGH